MMTRKFLAFVFLLSVGLQQSIAQVKGVNYALKYNSETCLFDVYMKVNEGVAKKTLDRAQFNAQLTIVAPVTSNVYVTESYMPLVNNQNRDGNSPANWEISNELESPKDMPGNRLVSVIPEILPTAFYNDLEAGDEVKLFSVKVSPITDCAKDVRLYDNNEDPTSDGVGMYGGDFRNGFTLGGIEQKYEGNDPVEYPDAPIIESVKFSMDKHIKLDVNAISVNNCASGLYYDVYGPQGLIGDLATFQKMDKSTIAKGAYRVVATDNVGCSTEKVFYPLGEESTTSTTEVVVADFSSEIFPVPAQNEINIIINGASGTKVSGSIIDMEGKIVRTNIINTTLNGGEEVFSYETNLSPGMYNIALSLDNKTKVNHKLLIIK